MQIEICLSFFQLEYACVYLTSIATTSSRILKYVEECTLDFTFLKSFTIKVWCIFQVIFLHWDDELFFLFHSTIMFIILIDFLKSPLHSQNKSYLVMLIFYYAVLLDLLIFSLASFVYINKSWNLIFFSFNAFILAHYHSNVDLIKRSKNYSFINFGKTFIRISKQILTFTLGRSIYSDFENTFCFYTTDNW